MVSESRLVLSVFWSVHQYSPCAVSGSRLAHTVKTRSPNVKRLKRVKPLKKTAPTHFPLPLTHAHINTRLEDRASEELYENAFRSSRIAKTTPRQGSAEPPR